MKQAGIVVIVGMRGKGKSFRAAKMVAAVPRVISVDPLYQFDRGAWSDRHDGPVLQAGSSPPARGPFWYDVEPDVENPEAMIADGARIALTSENCTLAIDEADLRLTATRAPRLFLQCLHIGRHYGVSVLVTARRTAGLPRLLTSQADTIVAFQTREPRDKVYFRDFTGTVPPGLETLPVGHYWRYRDGWTLHGKTGKTIRALD